MHGGSRRVAPPGRLSNLGRSPVWCDAGASANLFCPSGCAVPLRARVRHGLAAASPF